MICRKDRDLSGEEAVDNRQTNPAKRRRKKGSVELYGAYSGTPG